MEPIWSPSGGPEPLHFFIVIFSVFGFFAARFLLDSFVFQRLAIWWLNDGKAPKKLNEAKRAKVAKCSESMWKLTYYTTAQVWILTIGYHETWFTNRSEYFEGWPNQELKLPLMLYYLCQCGFYVYSIAALLTWETRRKDFFIMMSHHIVTVLLIGFSYITSFFRVGSVILALHDASDVFLEAAKLFKYSEKEFAASVCFGLFAISWFILRLIIFPFWVIRSSSIDAIEAMDTYSSPRLLYYSFNTMLVTLLVFHVYWWILIYSMIERQLKNRGKVGEDIRSGNSVYAFQNLKDQTCEHEISAMMKEFPNLFYLKWLGIYMRGLFPLDSVGAHFALPRGHVQCQDRMR
ncbi:hypothetical protein Scep_020303 [Stephania cephalantha]|uniref:TLC domain-containing protein n=1 Tax=Stephania cephalantha TaxID=152367 RepID=A0AAP0ICE4_9MAGN